ncbi:MAG: hypothetical protein ACRDWW_10690 [Acidimicrobiales bacterium]
MTHTALDPVPVPVPRSGSVPRRLALAITVVAGAALLAASGVIHLHLWAAGYRHIPTIGPLFLAQGTAAVVMAVTVLSWRRMLVALAGAALMVGTIAGFFASLLIGLFGFHDTFAAPQATLALIIEIAGAAALLATAWLRVAAERQHRAI